MKYLLLAALMVGFGALTGCKNQNQTVQTSDTDTKPLRMYNLMPTRLMPRLLRNAISGLAYPILRRTSAVVTIW